MVIDSLFLYIALQIVLATLGAYTTLIMLFKLKPSSKKKDVEETVVGTFTMWWSSVDSWES